MINIFTNSVEHRANYGIQDNENYMSVNSCGYLKLLTQNSSVSRDTGRVDYQIIYIIKGKGYYSFGDEITEIGNGNIVIFQPNIPQRYNYYFKDSTELYWVHFTGYAARKNLSELGLLDRRSYFIGESGECIELFKKVISELKIKKPLFMHYCSVYLVELILNIARILAALNEGLVVSDDIKKAIELMHANYNQNHPIGFYAQKSNLSMYRFIHKFKAATGVSPLEYITRIRINGAKDLLSSSSHSISEISSIVGYDNPLYFSRIFKRETGVSPSAYKNSKIT
ncbi:MAG: Arabinose operon regulatory protein [Firmicutes bacterium ADurb.Bin193]|nr:MAG: Arabinose operon regulatory protein [Firmicutes bacterium ADurb.Bin193]